MAKTKTATKSKPKTKRRTAPKKPDDIRALAKEYYLKEKEAFFDFAVTIFDIHKSGIWKDEWNYETWKDCAQGEWGISERSAYNRVTAGEAITKHKITKEQAAKAGWSNFITLASALTTEMTKTEVNGHLKEVAGKTHDEVARYTKEIKIEETGGTKQERVTLKFRFLDEQADVVLSAIAKCKELTGEQYDDTALEYICVEWNASHKVSAAKVEEIKGQLTPQPEEEKTKRKERVDKGRKRKTEEETVEEDELLGDAEGDDSYDEDDDLLGE